MSANTENKPVDLGRRRLTQGGLAGSVLLATLASKNALAAPYQCTMSGLLSGNQSPKGPATSQSCKLGPSADALANGADDWTPVDPQRDFYLIFSDVYYKLCVTTVDSTTCLLVKKGVADSVRATLGDVITLDPDPSNFPPNIALGRAAIAAYVGWSASANYPLSATQIQGMFNDTIGGGTHTLTSSLGDVNLDAAEVLRYFNYLTTGVTPHPKIIR